MSHLILRPQSDPNGRTSLTRRLFGYRCWTSGAYGVLWGIVSVLRDGPSPHWTWAVIWSSSVVEPLMTSKGSLFMVMHLYVLVNYELDGNINSSPKPEPTRLTWPLFSSRGQQLPGRQTHEREFRSLRNNQSLKTTLNSLVHHKK